MHVPPAQHTSEPCAAAGGGRPAKTTRRADAAALLLLLAGWMGWVAFATGGVPAVFYDTFRDTASVRAIQGGRGWVDPTLPGYPLWYAPGNPAMFTVASYLTGLPPEHVYATSAYVVNGLLVVLLYVLGRTLAGVAGGVVAVPLVLLGSLWWLTRAHGPMPSIQTSVLAWVTLLLWRHTLSGPRWAAGAAGITLAATVWCHPLTGVVAAGAIFLHAAMAGVGRTPGARRRAVARMLLLALVTGVLTSPLIAHLVELPKLNTAPFTYTPPEFFTFSFGLQTHAPLVLLLAAGGIVHLVRTARDQAWILGYLLVGAAGALLGYLGGREIVPVPYLLPHEFLWHAQFAVGLCATVGAVRLARFSAERASGPARLWLPFRSALTVTLLAALAPVLPQLPELRTHVLPLPPGDAAAYGWLAWLRAETPADALVLCHPEIGYVYVAGLTGRQCLALPPAHTNPAADVDAQWSLVARLRCVADEEEFTSLASSHGVDYLLIDLDYYEPEWPRELVAAYDRWTCLRLVWSAPASAIRIYKFTAPP